MKQILTQANKCQISKQTIICFCRWSIALLTPLLFLINTFALISANFRPSTSAATPMRRIIYILVLAIIPLKNRNLARKALRRTVYTYKGRRGSRREAPDLALRLLVLPWSMTLPAPHSPLSRAGRSWAPPPSSFWYSSAFFSAVVSPFSCWCSTSMPLSSPSWSSHSASQKPGLSPSMSSW